jgi:hypothetical protein
VMAAMRRVQFTPSSCRLVDVLQVRVVVVDHVQVQRLLLVHQLSDPVVQDLAWAIGLRDLPDLLKLCDQLEAKLFTGKPPGGWGVGLGSFEGDLLVVGHRRDSPRSRATSYLQMGQFYAARMVHRPGLRALLVVCAVGLGGCAAPGGVAGHDVTVGSVLVKLTTRCGIRDADFVGRHWRAVTPEPEPKDLHGTDGLVHVTGYTAGRMTMRGPDDAWFTITDPYVEQEPDVEFVPSSAPLAPCPPR